MPACGYEVVVVGGTAPGRRVDVVDDCRTRKYGGVRLAALPVRVLWEALRKHRTEQLNDRYRDDAGAAVAAMETVAAKDPPLDASLEAAGPGDARLCVRDRLELGGGTRQVACRKCFQRPFEHLG